MEKLTFCTKDPLTDLSVFKAEAMAFSQAKPWAVVLGGMEFQSFHPR